MTDLYLAPVVLAVDAQIQDYAKLSASELEERVALASDLPDYSKEFRSEALLKAVAHTIDMHDWQLSLDPRGIRISHSGHSLVLGVPETFRAYLAD
jgi:hypothetical protein